LIWIPTFDMVFPEGWHDEQEAASKALQEAADATARRRLLNGHLASVWKDLRDNMALLSRDKCWYCESPIIRDDLVVDHYRPKGAIFEDPQHGGYWWLALAFRNFRLTCKYCNELRVDKLGNTRGGKATHFPLLPGSIRATAADRSLDQEMPTILDPIEAADVEYLTFSVDAYVSPRWEESEDTVGFERASLTIAILHLNHGRIRRGRGQICNQVAEAIDRCDVAYRSWLRKRNEGAEPTVLHEAWRAYQSAVQRLAGFVYRTSPYAAAARAILRQARSEERSWVDALLMQ
jgi:hypothetical protein